MGGRPGARVPNGGENPPVFDNSDDNANAWGEWVPTRPSSTEFVGDAILEISTQQLEIVRAHIASGIECGVEALRGRYAADSGAELRECHCCSMGRFAEGAVCSDDDLVAGALVRFRGGMVGSLLLAMDPQNALDWVCASGHGDDPIETYLDLGTLLLGEVARSLAGGFGAEVDLATATLQEDCVGSILLRTHAPSDTAVISIRLDLAAGDCVVPAFIYALMEPKPLECALGTGA